MPRTNSKDFRRTTSMKPISMRTPDATWLDLRKPQRFQEFFQGLLEYLKSKLQLVTVARSHEYYTCGQLHEKWNQHWKPFQHLWAYCEKTGHDFYEAKDMIEERIGRNLICECELLNDEKAIRRKELQTMFGVDFGPPGARDLDIQ
jgi:hypothetical protein